MEHCDKDMLERKSLAPHNIQKIHLVSGTYILLESWFTGMQHPVAIEFALPSLVSRPNPFSPSLLFLALVGVLSTENGDEGNGLATKALEIEGVTSCATSQNMPSTDIYQGFQITHVNGAVFAFGGKVGHLEGSRASYKYELETNTWTRIADMNSKRYLMAIVPLSEDEIFITGKC